MQEIHFPVKIKREGAEAGGESLRDAGLTPKRGGRSKGRSGRKSLRLQGSSAKVLSGGWKGSKRRLFVRQVPHGAEVAKSSVSTVLSHGLGRAQGKCDLGTNMKGNPKVGSCAPRGKEAEQGTSTNTRMRRVLGEGEEDTPRSLEAVDRSVGNVQATEAREGGGWRLCLSLPVAYPISALPILLSTDLLTARHSHVTQFWPRMEAGKQKLLHVPY